MVELHFWYVMPFAVRTYSKKIVLLFGQRHSLPLAARANRQVPGYSTDAFVGPIPAVGKSQLASSPLCQFLNLVVLHPTS